MWSLLASLHGAPSASCQLQPRPLSVTWGSPGLWPCRAPYAEDPRALRPSPYPRALDPARRGFLTPSPPAGESHSLPRFWWVSELGRCQPSLAGSDPLLGGQAVGCTQCSVCRGDTWPSWRPGCPWGREAWPQTLKVGLSLEGWRGAEAGQNGGTAGVCSLFPKGSGSPSRTLVLGSCQAQAPPPSLSHCHLSAGQGTRLWAFPSCLGIRIPEAP